MNIIILFLIYLVCSHGIKTIEIDPEKMIRFNPNKKLCLVPSLYANSQTQIIKNITLSSCIDNCVFEINCSGVIYNNKTCTKTNKLHMTDKTQAIFTQFVGSKTLVYSKVALRFYAERCLGFNKVSCTGRIGCSWNRGLRGYNQPSNLPYCGLLKCPK
jgi:long-subunit acyl-CoA synthetase (AMP-forming)